MYVIDMVWQDNFWSRITPKNLVFVDTNMMDNIYNYIVDRMLFGMYIFNTLLNAVGTPQIKRFLVELFFINESYLLNNFSTSHAHYF